MEVDFMLTIEELYDMITPENYIEIGNCIYFYGKDIRLDIDFLCRVEIMHKKEYCSIKNGKKMSVFDPAIGKGKDIYNYYKQKETQKVIDYLKRERA